MSYETQQTNDSDESSIDQHEETRQRWDRRVKDSSLILADDVMPATLADEFGVLDADQIDEISSEAGMIAIREGRSTVTLEDFQTAFDAVDVGTDDTVVQPDTDPEEKDEAEDETEALETVDVVESEDGEEQTVEAEDSQTTPSHGEREEDSRTVTLRQHAEVEKETKELREQVDSLKTVVDKNAKTMAFVRQAFGQMFDTEITDVQDFRSGAVSFREEFDAVQDQVDQHQQQMTTISDLGEQKTTKEEKIQAIVTFAARQREEIDEKITVPPKSMAGAAGCSKRYAYDLVDELHDDENFPWASDASKRDVHLEQDKPQRGLLIDFGKTSVQHDGQPLNKFNNETSGNGGE